MKKTRVKLFNVTLQITYEGYNGYDHTTNFQYDIKAMNEKVAEKRARLLFDKKGGGYRQRGYVSGVKIQTNPTEQEKRNMDKERDEIRKTEILCRMDTIKNELDELENELYEIELRLGEEGEDVKDE